MDLLRAIILGIVQALTEFVPISSSAHLILFREWIGLTSVDGLTFDIAVHFGSVIAVIAYFRRDLLRLLRGGLSVFRGVDLDNNLDQRLALYVLLATIPAAVVGVFFLDVIDSMLREPRVIVVALVGGSVIFLLVERACRPTGTLRRLVLRSALFIGVVQAVALIPGVSRSGITIATGMTQGLKREQAARFSFLLSVPVLLGAPLRRSVDMAGLDITSSSAAVLLAGTIASCVTAWFVIKYLMIFLRRHSLNVFAYYRLALAVVVLLWIVL